MFREWSGFPETLVVSVISLRGFPETTKLHDVSVISLRGFPETTTKSDNKEFECMKPRIAFDLDETLGATITDSTSIVGFCLREGCIELLEKLQKKYYLVLWTVSNRTYLDKVLSFGLKKYFKETYSWDEISISWKDIRQIGVNFLIDDSEYHKEIAKQHGLSSRYIIIPAFGSPEDVKNSRLWIMQIEEILL
jgi:hypothetical protein